MSLLICLFEEARRSVTLHWRWISADWLRLTCAPLVAQLTRWYAHARHVQARRAWGAATSCTDAVPAYVYSGQVPVMTWLTGSLPRRLVWWTQSISRGKAGRGGRVLSAIANWMRLFNGQSHLEAIVSSGLFEECASGVASLAVAGVDGLGDVNHESVPSALTLLRYCRQQPGAEARIRRLAPALKWCLEHDLDWMEQLGMTTGSSAAQICESVAAHCRATVQL